MAEESEQNPDLVGLAFTLIGERGWRGFSFAELARRAELPLAQVYAELPDRGALLRSLGRRLDAEMLAVEASELEGMSPRERVFELIMRRFDAMAPVKPALRSLARDGARDPGLTAAGLCNVGRLATRLLDAAETRDGPTAHLIARHVLAAIYVRVFNVWLDDDTVDLARTLAELDRRLQQAEGMARWLSGFRRPGREESAEGKTPSPAPA